MNTDTRYEHASQVGSGYTCHNVYSSRRGLRMIIQFWHLLRVGVISCPYAMWKWSLCSHGIINLGKHDREFDVIIPDLYRLLLYKDYVYMLWFLCLDGIVFPSNVKC